MARSCGSCSACCTTHAVPEVPKEAGCACPHLRAGTKPCGVYQTRPSGCQEFVCLWLRGMGSTSQRPDRLGVVFDFVDGPAGTRVLRAYELREGAADQDAAQTIEQFRRMGYPVSICHAGAVRAVVLPDGRRTTRAEYEARQQGGE